MSNGLAYAGSFGGHRLLQHQAPDSLCLRAGMSAFKIRSGYEIQQREITLNLNKTLTLATALLAALPSKISTLDSTLDRFHTYEAPSGEVSFDVVKDKKFLVHNVSRKDAFEKCLKVGRSRGALTATPPLVGSRHELVIYRELVLPSLGLNESFVSMDFRKTGGFIGDLYLFGYNGSRILRDKLVDSGPGLLRRVRPYYTYKDDDEVIPSLCVLTYENGHTDAWFRNSSISALKRLTMNYRQLDPFLRLILQMFASVPQSEDDDLDPKVVTIPALSRIHDDFFAINTRLKFFSEDDMYRIDKAVDNIVSLFDQIHIQDDRLIITLSAIEVAKLALTTSRETFPVIAIEPRYRIGTRGNFKSVMHFGSLDSSHRVSTYLINLYLRDTYRLDERYLVVKNAEYSTSDSIPVPRDCLPKKREFGNVEFCHYVEPNPSMSCGEELRINQLRHVNHSSCRWADVFDSVGYLLNRDCDANAPKGANVRLLALSDRGLNETQLVIRCPLRDEAYKIPTGLHFLRVPNNCYVHVDGSRLLRVPEDEDNEDSGLLFFPEHYEPLGGIRATPPHGQGWSTPDSADDTASTAFNPFASDDGDEDDPVIPSLDMDAYLMLTRRDLALIGGLFIGIISLGLACIVLGVKAARSCRKRYGRIPTWIPHRGSRESSIEESQVGAGQGDREAQIYDLRAFGSRPANALMLTPRAPRRH